MYHFFIKRPLLALCISLLFSNLSEAQHNLYNPHSLRPVREDDIMFRKTLWFRVDLRTKFNSAFFAQNHEISKVLIDAVKNGRIIPYMNDSLGNRMSIEEFNRRLTLSSNTEKVLSIESDSWDNETWVSKKPLTHKKEKKQQAADKSSEIDQYLPQQLYILELKEDLIFDKRESRMKHDLLAVKLIIPSEQNSLGIEKELASFSYKELIQNNVFRNNSNAIWYNSANQAEHRTLEEAFELALFRGHLVKYSNLQDNSIVDMYTNKKRALQASEQMLHELMEYEYLLWSY